MKQFKFKDGFKCVASTKEEAIKKHKVVSAKNNVSIPKNFKMKTKDDGGVYLFYALYTGNKSLDDMLSECNNLEFDNEEKMKDFISINKKDFKEFDQLINKLKSNYIMFQMETD